MQEIISYHHIHIFWNIWLSSYIPIVTWVLLSMHLSIENPTENPYWWYCKELHSFDPIIKLYNSNGGIDSVTLYWLQLTFWKDSGRHLSRNRWQYWSVSHKPAMSQIKSVIKGPQPEALITFLQGTFCSKTCSSNQTFPEGLFLLVGDGPWGGEYSSLKFIQVPLGEFKTSIFWSLTICLCANHILRGLKIHIRIQNFSSEISSMWNISKVQLTVRDRRNRLWLSWMSTWIVKMMKASVPLCKSGDECTVHTGHCTVWSFVLLEWIF